MKFIGAATSAHQIEGNVSNDWTYFEKKGLVPEVGEACNSWVKMEEDIKLLKSIGANAYRFSIEWSRIEPEEGLFNIKALERYKRFVNKLLENDIEPFITLHHFTNPIWFFRMGGWVNSKIVRLFSRYVDFITKYLKEVRFWITINEPNVYAYNGYVVGIWPPAEKSILKAIIVVRNMIKASSEAYGIIKSNINTSYVGMAHHVRVFQPVDELSKIPAFIREYLFNFLPIYSDVYAILPPPAGFMENLKNKADFVGLNYYTKDNVKFSLKSIFGEEVVDENSWKNSLGWEVYPRGIYEVSLKFSFGMPVFITENGIATEDRQERIRFIKEHFHWLKEAMKKGVNVMGYFYWSLMDNYEWKEGYKAKFGIFTRDRKPKGKLNLRKLWEE